MLQFKQNAERFYKFRKANGAIELDFPEVKITVKKNGTVKMTELGILDLPFLVRDRPHMYKAMDGGQGKKLSKAMDGKGFRLLGF